MANDKIFKSIFYILIYANVRTVRTKATITCTQRQIDIGLHRNGQDHNYRRNLADLPKKIIITCPCSNCLWQRCLLREGHRLLRSEVVLAARYGWHPLRLPVPGPDWGVRKRKGGVCQTTAEEGTRPLQLRCRRR